jgi:hypothetical protein
MAAATQNIIVSAGTAHATQESALLLARHALLFSPIVPRAIYLSLPLTTAFFATCISY